MLKIKQYYDKDTATLTYVVYKNGVGIIIDPLMGFNYFTGKIDHKQFDEVMSFLASESIDIKYILETHIHADHISGSQLYKKEFPLAQLAVSKHIPAVQKIFTKIFSLDLPVDGSQFDQLFDDKDSFKVGDEFEISVIATPGHTPMCTSFLIEDHVFVGDCIFLPDQGCGRCDFPGGSASDHYNSIYKKLYALPDDTRVYVGHEYRHDGNKYFSTIGEQKRDNVMARGDKTQDQYISDRQKRDCELAAPKLINPSLQVNMNAGILPNPDSTGKIFLKLPLNID